jgi:hypothetical protein
LPEPGGGGRTPDCAGAAASSRRRDFCGRGFRAQRGFRRLVDFFGDPDFVRSAVLRKISVLL